jgi:GBP family porin
MKRLSLALGAFGTFAGAAYGQSSLTLYGIVDAGITYVSNQAPGPAFTNGSKNVMASAGNIQGSRWGLKGTEDLGGNLKAIFTLENGFNEYTGTLSQGGREFGRQAFVGLSSATAGTLTFGRQYDSVSEYVGTLTANQWATIVGAHPFDNDNLDNTFRINNSVKYATVNYNGFSADAVYGFSNQANTGAGTGFADNRAWSLGGSYTNGQVTLAAAAMFINSPNAASNPGGAVGNDYPSFAALGARAAGAVERQRIYAGGASYVVGTAAFGLVYSRSKFDFVANAGSLKFDNFETNFKYTFSPELRMGASYTYTSGRLSGASAAPDTSPKFHQVNLGLDYSLSKRTDTYLVGLYQRAAGDASHASLYTIGVSSTRNQFAVIAGLRQKF